jgi:hypothetical protein
MLGLERVFKLGQKHIYVREHQLLALSNYNNYIELPVKIYWRYFTVAAVLWLHGYTLLAKAKNSKITSLVTIFL